MLAWITILAILLQVYLVSNVIHEGHNWGDDFALYIHQAKVLAGDGTISALAKTNRFSMQHSEKLIGPYLYPPGFPILLSPVYSMYGLDFKVLKWFCAIFLIASIALFYRLVRADLPEGFWAVFGVVLLAMNDELLLFTDNVLSDLPFFFFCLLSFYLLKLPNTPIRLILLGCTVFYAYLIRDIGVVLLPSIIGYQLFNTKRSEWKKTILLPLGVFVILLAGSKFYFPGGQENHYQEILKASSAPSYFFKFRYYLEWLGACFKLPFENFFSGLLIVCLATIGTILNWRKNVHLTIFLLSYLSILIIWPAIQGVRFIFPLIPVCLLLIFQVSNHIVTQFKGAAYILSVLAIIYLLPYSLATYKNVMAYSKTQSNQAFTSEMQAIYLKLSQADAPQGIIAFEKPRLLTLCTGRTAIYCSPKNFAASKANLLLLNKQTMHELKDTTLHVKQSFGTYVLLEKQIRY